MRYKEFEDKIEDWGEKYGYETEVVFGGFYTNVEVGTDEAYYVAAHISNIFMFDLETRWDYSTKIKNHARGELFDILIEFAKTPLEDRRDEEVKKYKFKHKYLGGSGNNYLIYDAIITCWYIGGGITTPDFKVKFTIEELKEKFNSNLDDWEIIEVEE